METIYNKYYKDIESSYYRTVMPVSDLNFNSPNNYTTFKLDFGDMFYNGRIMYHIMGKYTKKDGTDYPAMSTINLVDNFPAFLFTRVELRKHNTLIDVVEHPGITSTMKGLVTYKGSQKPNLHICGFESKFQGGGRFEAYGALSHLGLGFLDNLHHPMYKGGFEITFTRAGDNDALYHWKLDTATATEPEDGKVVIEEFKLLVPLVDYKATSRIQLINDLKSLSDNGKLVYNYLQWQCIDKKGIFGSNFSFDITGAYRNVYNPKFVIIGLQTNRSNAQNKNTSLFDHCNIKNASVRINGERYPHELLNLDIANNKSRMLYDMYQNVRRAVFGDDEVYLDAGNFIGNYPLIVLNTSLHPSNIDRSKSEIIIDLDFANPVAAPTGTTGTTAYVVVVSEAHFTYDITRNIITSF